MVEDVRFVFILSVAWGICFAVCIFYLIAVSFAFVQVCYSSYKYHSLFHSRGLKGTISAESGLIYDVSNNNGKILSGFFEMHMKASVAYTRRLLPRIRRHEEKVTDENALIADLQTKPKSAFLKKSEKGINKQTQSLREKIRTLLTAVTTSVSHFLSSFESTHEAFFFPQRMIIAALVSIISCLFFVYYLFIVRIILPTTRKFL
jgi:hypothetical protein